MNHKVRGFKTPYYLSGLFKLKFDVDFFQWYHRDSFIFADPIKSHVKFVYDIHTFICLPLLSPVNVLVFRVIEGLDRLVNLKRLYLVSNKITKIQNLEALTQLQMLELGDNRIRQGD